MTCFLVEGYSILPKRNYIGVSKYVRLPLERLRLRRRQASPTSQLASNYGAVGVSIIANVMVRSSTSVYTVSDTSNIPQNDTDNYQAPVL